MPFVKLDTGILNSTIWVEKGQRDVFITALLLAHPMEIEQAVEQIEVRSLERTGFKVPPGWYGFVPAASVGIIRHAMVSLDDGLESLEKLGRPDPESRSKAFEGRRMIRVDGGFLILNYMKYRDMDHGAADRMRRLRERRKQMLHGSDKTLQDVTVTPSPLPRNVTQADSREQIADAELKTMAAVPDLPSIQLARGIAEKLRIPCETFNLRAIAAAIDSETSDGHTGTATEFLLAKAKEAQAEGKNIDRWWFSGTAWRKPKKEPKKKRTTVNPADLVRQAEAEASGK